MAKTGFWLKGANGKLAGATIYQQNGETVMREVVSPSNPKTDAQLVQRIVMNTVMGAYSVMKAICDHSFEGIKKGQDTMAYFMKRNVKLTRQAIERMQGQGLDFYDMYNFLALGQKGFAPNQYILSMGTLPQIFCSLSDDNYLYGFISNVTTNTYQGVCDALGLERGDQLTFLCIHARQGQTAENVQFDYVRVILDPTAADGSQLPMSTAFCADNAIVSPSIRNEGALLHIGIDAEAGLSFSTRSNTMLACAAIASRKSGNDWLRSTAILTYTQSGFNQDLGSCLDAAKTGNDFYVGSPPYLNHAGEGGGAIDPQGGQTGNLSITSVTCNNSPVTLGTPLTMPDVEGQALSLQVKVNATGVTDESIRITSSNTAAQTVNANFVDGVATANINVPLSTQSIGNYTFTVKLVKDGEEIATGYVIEASLHDAEPEP